MAYPSGIIRRTVTFGPGFELEDGDVAGMTVTFKATRPGVLWRATGQPAVSREKVVTAEDGVEGSVELPVTDQAGWGDGNGNEIVLADGDHAFLYTIKVQFTQDGRPIPGANPRDKVVAIPQGDGSPLDLDDLIPLTSPGGTVVSVPDIWSQQIFDIEEAVGVSAEFVGSQIADPASPAGAAVAAKIQTVGAGKFAPLKEFDPRAFGAVYDNVTDDYDAWAATFIAAAGWTAFGGQAVISKPAGCAYLGKAGAGGLLLPTNAIGLTIKGQGDMISGFRLSKEVLRVFDLLTYNSAYRGIKMSDFYIDADNIDDTAVGAPTTCSATTITGGSTNTVITVASTAGWATKGACFFPSTNAGTAKQLRLPFVKIDATHIRVTHYGSDVTLANGDTVQGAINDHLIIGTQTGSSVTQSTDIIGLEVSDIRVINVPTKPVASFDADQPHVRWGSCVAPRTATAPTTPTMVRDIRFRRVRIYGGECGLYVGSFGTAPQNIQCFVDNINFEDCYHSTKVLPTANYFSLNFEIGGSGSGNRAAIRRCTGWGSGDVGIEINGMLDAVSEDNLMEEFQGIGYYQANYGIPCDSSAGPPSMVLASALSDTTGTAATIVALPTEGIPSVGYAVIDTEVVQYTIASDTTLTLSRGFNGSTAATHASGVVVRTFPVHRQRIRNVRNRARLKLITPDPATPGRMPPAFAATAQAAKYPHAPMSIKDGEVENSLSMMGSRGLTGEIVHVSGWTPSVEVDGLRVARHGIVHTDLNSRSGAMIVVKSVSTGATGPQTLFKLDGIEAAVSGKLATGTNSPTYSIVAPDTGRWVLDWGSISADMRFRNSQAQATWAIAFVPTGAAMRLHGSCKRFRLSTPVSGDGAPRVLLCNGSFTLDHFHIEDLDLTDMWFGSGAGNPNYQPITAGTYAPAVSVRTWRHPSIIAATTLYSQRNGRRRTSYTSSATLAATDEYVGCNFTAAGTITLRAVNATGSVAAPNPAVGREVWIKDEAGNAGTNTITVTPASGETIDGSTSSKTITTNGGMLKLMAVGTGWVTI